MPTGSDGMLDAPGIPGEYSGMPQDSGGPAAQGAASPRCACGAGGAAGATGTTGTAGSGGLVNSQPLTGQGAQFVYAAATVANILTNNLTATQINLLANFLSVVTTCVYAILTVENPTDVLES